MTTNTKNNSIQETDDNMIHNKPSDKLMIIISALVSGISLSLVACLVLKYPFYVGLLYFIGMSVWVILFFEYFDFSLFRNTPESKNG